MSDFIDRDYFETVRKARATGAPIARYRKAIVGNVGVRLIDPFTGRPTDIVLTGSPNDKGRDEDDYTITLWTTMEHDFFRKANRPLLEKGFLSKYDGSPEEIEVTPNEISDDEISDVLGQPYFALMNLLKTLTSPNTVMRVLRLAEELNRPVGTITKIKERLSELQAIDEGL